MLVFFNSLHFIIILYLFKHSQRIHYRKKLHSVKYNEKNIAQQQLYLSVVS